jgi:hypothetical protein
MPRLQRQPWLTVRLTQSHKRPILQQRPQLAACSPQQQGWWQLQLLLADGQPGGAGEDSHSRAVPCRACCCDGEQRAVRAEAQGHHCSPLCGPGQHRVLLKAAAMRVPQQGAAIHAADSEQRARCAEAPDRPAAASIQLARQPQLAACDAPELHHAAALNGGGYQGACTAPGLGQPAHRRDPRAWHLPSRQLPAVCQAPQGHAAA